MKNLTRRSLRAAIAAALPADGQCVANALEVRVARNEKQRRAHGDFSSNAPLLLRRLDDKLVAQLVENLRGFWPGTMHESQGFLNFHMDQQTIDEKVAQAAREGARYGSGVMHSGRRFNIEFVSSDPTGPLPLSAARIAACGEALCRLQEAQGAGVTREFFLNDVPASSKMRLLGESVSAFYEAHFNGAQSLPEGILQDDFVRGVARDIAARDGNKHLLSPEVERNEFFAREAAQTAVRLQKEALQNFGVRFDLWTSENALRGEGRVQSALEKLARSGHSYEKEGAVWLKTSAFGDDADHPLTRAGAQPTYLASDIAYHAWKFERGFDKIINIWSGEHRPYVARTHAALQALGCDVSKLQILVCEGARLRLDGETMQGRDGAPLSWDEALAEADAEALRLHFLLAAWDETARIDLEVATRDDENNPAYAVRLAPSRLAALLREAEANGAAAVPSPEEQEVARLVALWPDTLEHAATTFEPQRVARWAVDFAGAMRRLRAAARPGALPQPITLRGAQAALAAALHILGIEAREQF
jgi:arginyl-tRNA synthetase